MGQSWRLVTGLGANGNLLLRFSHHVKLDIASVGVLRVRFLSLLALDGPRVVHTTHVTTTCAFLLRDRFNLSWIALVVLKDEILDSTVADLSTAM